MKIPKLFKKSKPASGGGGGASDGTSPAPLPLPPPSPPASKKSPPESVPQVAPPSPSSRDNNTERKKSKKDRKDRKSSKSSSRNKSDKHSKSRADPDAYNTTSSGGGGDDDYLNNEPKMLVAVGTRRKSELAPVNIRSLTEDAEKSLTIDDSTGASGNGGSAAGTSTNGDNSNNRRQIPRKSSSKHIKLGESDASVAGNFMQNIHSSPLQATLNYAAPVYPKSEKDIEFISIALQRNFVFANALSDEDVSRKREMKQIVDAFEGYTVNEVGKTILSAGEVGDYFYILKEGCVEYKNVNPATGKYGVVGMAKRPGQSFGELCLLYDCPPPADSVSGPASGAQVRTKDGSSCNLWRIHKLTFRQIMALRTMRRDERLRDAIRKIPQFDGLDDEFINRIANALDVRTVKKHEVIYNAGEEANEFFIVGSESKVITGEGGEVIKSGEAFGTEAIHDGSSSGGKRRKDTVKAERRTTLLVMSREHLDRTIGSLKDAIILSQDRRLLKSIPLFRDSDFEDFEYELLAALIERVTYKGGKLVYEEEEMVEEPALMIVRSGILDQFSDRNPDNEKVLRDGDYFGEDSLTPDNNLKFGGAKGGTKYREETVEVVSDIVECGKLSLANIDSVILDLHRLGCNRPGNKKYGGSRVNRSNNDEPRPESLDDLEFHNLFGAGTFGRVWIVSRHGGKTAYALKIQSKRELLDQRQASSAKRERAVMAKLDHPFVCRLTNTFQDDACIYMLLPLIQGGEMHGGLPEIATKFYAAGILEGLTYMHRRHIVYRDLKPENVLLDADGYAVIVDFGFCKWHHVSVGLSSLDVFHPYLNTIF